VRIDDALGRYIEHAKNTFPRGMTLEGLRIVVDCGHGAAYKATPTVLRELGAEVFAFGVSPNGTNINLDCGSMHPEMMCQKVWEHRAHLGIAHDGDADRVLLCDEQANSSTATTSWPSPASTCSAGAPSPKNTVVSTVMSNAGLEAALNSAGGHLIRTAVGDKHVIDEMLTNGYNFGGEQSGHMIFGDHSTTGDGLVAALQILSVMQTSGKPLSELARMLDPLPPAGHQRQSPRETPVRGTRPVSSTWSSRPRPRSARTAAGSCSVTPAPNPRPACSSKAATPPPSKRGVARRTSGPRLMGCAPAARSASSSSGAKSPSGPSTSVTPSTGADSPPNTARTGRASPRSDATSSKPAPRRPRKRASVAAGVPPAVEGGVSPPGVLGSGSQCVSNF
jgi:hypothetical protein